MLGRCVFSGRTSSAHASPEHRERLMESDPPSALNRISHVCIGLGEGVNRMARPDDSLDLRILCLLLRDRETLLGDRSRSSDRIRLALEVSGLVYGGARNRFSVRDL